MSDASSSSISSFSLDGMSFILEEFSDDSPILENIVNNENGPKLLELGLKIRQFKQQNRASSSSRRPRKNKRYVKRDQQEAHDRLYKEDFAEDSIYNETHLQRKFRMRKH